MKFELKDMYNFLLSHTFPGSLVLAEILLCLQWFAQLDVWEFLKGVWSSSSGGAIVLLIFSYAGSTLLGNVLDATHHFILEDFLRKPEDDKKFRSISDNLTMNIYKHFLEDDLWYPYEEYANLFFAMIPGWILLGYWLSAIMRFDGWRLWIPILFYGIVLFIVLGEAIYTYLKFTRDEKTFIAVYSQKKGADSEKGEKC